MRLNELYQRDGGICHICKNPVPRAQASRDHLIPRSVLRATLTIEQRRVLGVSEANVALAHKSCNSRRGSKELEDLEFPDPQEHQNPAWFYLRARKNHSYCICPCMCKFQLHVDMGTKVCDNCRVHFISYV